MTDIRNNRYCNFEYLESKRIVLLPLSEQGIADDSNDTWYAIVDRENHASVGMIGMVHRHPEWRITGLRLVISDEEKRREGYGLEALELVERYIFDILAYQRIAVQIADFNQTAIQFFKKAGYKLEGVQESGVFCNDRYYNVILLRLLRKEYMSRREIRSQ